MSIFDKVKDAAMHQFIEVIEWLDNTGDTIVYRYPVEGQEIKNGAQLIVRESQNAVFVFEGQVADVFTPGRYTIDGGNTPILTKLGAWKYGFDSPFKSEVYFVNTKQFTDMKWGTSNPIMRPRPRMFWMPSTVLSRFFTYIPRCLVISIRFSFSITSSTASAAAQARWLPPKVVPSI